MFSPTDIAKMKADLAVLENAHDKVNDTGLREIISRLDRRREEDTGSSGSKKRFLIVRCCQFAQFRLFNAEPRSATLQLSEAQHLFEIDFLFARHRKDNRTSTH
jgi:hypothetical protein